MNLNLQLQEFDALHLPEYVDRQIQNFFPLEGKDDLLVIQDAMPATLQRLAHCFKYINFPAYFSGNVPRFSILHSDQYAAFLYLLSNEVFNKNGVHPAAKKIFYLNKALHSLNCMYDVQLPPVFLFLHLVGAVIGKAQYGNYLVVRQGCTIGALRGKYPTLGDGFIMSPGSSIIGPRKVGAGVMLTPDTSVMMGEEIPPSTLVSGNHAHGLVLRPLSDVAFAFAFKQHFNVNWKDI